MKKINNASQQVTKIDLLVLREDLEKKFEETNENNRKYKDQILTGLDGVMKELETMREESTIGTHQTRELRKDVDGHEERITTLESSN
ncbi:MAG: hypothetical protein COY68_00960 [Candidatus Levybacteria bacterium CG_4_10_14_0_8_um_filter_35_23]|nr:MAG: hypothetical protein COY68_00960 [Candidatus Levybacteria bacterium CG_4_10_14_0_8_um_filter_35_23]